MSVEALAFAEPFFTVKHLVDEAAYPAGEKCILVNLSETAIDIQGQNLGFLQSVVVANTVVRNVERAVLVERFASYADADSLFASVRAAWPLAYEVRKEERLKGVSHYMSPKATLGDVTLSMYHAGSVPLNVGLHKTHPHCDAPGFREVHTQIVGFGKMQQCRERDVGTLYLEEMLAPGATHKPMYDAQGNYPWHQYETVTPGIFMAVEIMPAGPAGAA